MAPPGLYFSHPAFLEHDPRAGMPGHPENPDRLIAIDRVLGAREWLGWERREAPTASESQLRLIHDERLVELVRATSASGGGALDPDTFAGPASYEAALRAAGGACAMADSLLSGKAPIGFSAGRPPGHHAEANRAMGFCLFNSVAVAAEHAIRELGVARVFILDWDVHHGNGTAEAFRHRDDVLYASIHQGDFYPGTGPLEDVGSGAGEGFTINLPVPAGSEEELWLSLIEHVVLPAARVFSPELVLVSAGFDAHLADPLAACRLSSDSFARMARHVRDLAAGLDVPLGMVLEGGYEPDALAESLALTLSALDDAEPAPSTAPEPLLTPLAATHIGRYWKLA